MNEIIEKVRKDLILNSNEKERLAGERFFKEEVRLYGMKANMLRKISGENWIEIKHLPISEIFTLCEELWKSNYLEETGIAIEWVICLKKQITKEDFSLFERWVAQYVTNWANCDGFCNHPVGDLVMRYPEFLSDLKRWTQSPNRWMRRASAVSLIVPARKGFFLPAIFEIAELLLTDRDDMVQKGYGWMLKAASEAHREEVFNFVMAHKAKMPRTALRYAIEKMPEEMRKKAMEKSFLPD
jgi:3-methyladenine DNA glycosylase AlkD